MMRKANTALAEDLEDNLPETVRLLGEL